MEILMSLIALPKLLMVEPTTKCNLRCPQCYIALEKKESREFEIYMYEKLLEEIGNALEVIELYNYGEPFLYDDLYKMVRYAKYYNILLYISTNLSFKEKDRIFKVIEEEPHIIRVAFDGYSTPHFLDNFRLLLRWKTVPDGFTAETQRSRR